MDLEKLICHVEVIAKDAGEVIKECYLGGEFESFTKEDESPVTSADLAANQVICEALAKLTPEIPIMSEELTSVDFSQRQHWPRYWLIDPLDGTQEFIAKSGDFAVSIALIENNRPVLGVIYAPMTECCYFATRGQGAFKRDPQGLRQIQIQKADNRVIRIAVSLRQEKHKVFSQLSELFDYQLIPLGSATLKSCLVAEGGADCYIRVGPTGEWDTGAAHCILHEAGGDIKNLQLDPLTYNQRTTLQNPDFIVCGDPDIAWSQLLKEPE